MTPVYRLSDNAEQDIEAILARTQREFGDLVRRRYEALLIRAILDIAQEPERTGSHPRPEIAPAARTYHLRNSRDRVEKSIGKIHRPRHFLVFRVHDKTRDVEIARVLHDGVDLKRPLSDEDWD